MDSKFGLSVTKPVSVWNRPLKVNYKDLFIALGKAAADGVMGKWDSIAGDLIDAATAIGLGTDAGQIAYLLLYRSLARTIASLAKENKALLGNVENLDASIKPQLDLSFEDIPLTINQNFFEHPKDLPILEAIKAPFAQWLEGFGLTKSQTQSINNRLPRYFVFELRQEWRTNAKDYTCLKSALDTPFEKAGNREQEWMYYEAFLQKQVAEPVFEETFSLSQIYVPLRAHYERKHKGQEGEELKSDIVESKQNERVERVVVDLEAELESWLDKADKDDAIRIISGGPGSGKSSFAKIFAAKQSEKGLSVLLVPLHQLDLSDDMINIADAVGEFVRDYGYFTHNPLDRNNIESRLFIIFDGLDELVMRGDVAKRKSNVEESAREFAREAQRKAEKWNRDGIHLQILINGREVIVESLRRDFRQSQQILHILPYFLTEEERKETSYVDTQNLLAQDQRQRWWQLYGGVSGREYGGLPPELDRDDLIEITAQPLLNYLVALMHIKGELKLSEVSNRNTIYENLLEAVYHRKKWAGRQYVVLERTEYSIFISLLGEIALACWHNDGRTATISQMRERCQSPKLRRHLDEYQKGADAGILSLLTAFYFRRKVKDDGENTFEFTHKSFCEYLTARGIVQQVNRTEEELERLQQSDTGKEGWSETEALESWINLCGRREIDSYLFRFISDEVCLRKSSDVSNWQKALCQLLGFVLCFGMPMDSFSTYLFKGKCVLERNAAEALLIVLNACARFTQEVSEIQYPYNFRRSEELPLYFGRWISKLNRDKTYENTLSLSHLSFLNLNECFLYCRDLSGANLERTNLKKANLRQANLFKANLKHANLGMANLWGSDLRYAVLKEANLRGANLREANLRGANLVEVHLEEADCKEAIFRNAKLKGVHFNDAKLQGADFRDASMSNVKLDNVSWDGNTKWCAWGLHEATGVPEALSQQPEFAAAVALSKGASLAIQGKIEEAVAAYDEAQRLDSRVEISTFFWNALCWCGGLHNSVADGVLHACDRMLQIEPEDGLWRDSRGLARALAGDTSGAIEDFQAAIESEVFAGLELAKRHSWLEALLGGNNPFTDEELEKLRQDEGPNQAEST